MPWRANWSRIVVCLLFGGLLLGTPLAAPAAADWRDDDHIDQLIEVQWMQDLEPFLENVRPGANLVLAPGVFRPQTLRGLRGTAERPIVIRGPRTGLQPVIGGGAVGLHLIDVEHVVIEGIAFRDQSEAAIRIESRDDGASSVVLRRIRIHSLRPSADGIVVDGARDITVDDAIIRNWGQAAIRLRDATEIRLIDCRLLAFGRRFHPKGLEIESGTRIVRVDRLSAEHQITEAIRVGVDALVEVKDVEFTDCLIRGARTGVRFGHASNVRLRRSTLVDLETAMLRFDPATIASPGGAETAARRATDIVVDRCIFDWSRKRLGALFVGAPDAGVRLGPNLWHGPDAGERLLASEAILSRRWLDAVDATDDDSDRSLLEGQRVDLDPQLDLLGNVADDAPAAIREFGARGTLASTERSGLDPRERPAQEAAESNRRTH